MESKHAKKSTIIAHTLKENKIYKLVPRVSNAVFDETVFREKLIIFNATRLFLRVFKFNFQKLVRHVVAESIDTFQNAHLQLAIRPVINL